MKKKIVSALLCVAMAASLVVGCGSKSGSDSGSSKGGDKLVYWAMWSEDEPQAKVIKEAISKYEKDTGVKVDVQFKGRTGQREGLEPALSAKQQIDLFDEDVNRVNGSWGKYLLDLEDMAKDYESEHGNETLFKIARNAYGQTHDGDDALHSIPYQPSIFGFFYNKTLFTKAGIESVPTTWEELDAACAKLKEAGIQPFNYSDKDNYHFEHLMSALALKAYGTSIADDLASDKEAYNGEKMVAIYQKMKDMIDAGYWGDGILSTDFNTERNMFEAGKAAFTVDGTWNCGNFQNDSDTTLFDAQKIGVTRIPYIDEANKTVEMGGGSDTYYITTLNKSDEEIAATVKFIKYLTSVDSINEMCKSSPTTYAEKVTIDTGNYLLDDVNAIMAENTESKLEIPTYDTNTAAMDTIRNSLQALATGASAQEVGDDIVDKMSAYE